MRFKAILTYSNFSKTTFGKDEPSARQLTGAELAKRIKCSLEDLWTLNIGNRLPPSDLAEVLRTCVMNQAPPSTVKAILHDTNQPQIVFQPMDHIREREFHLIHFAARYGHLQVIELLVREFRVNVNIGSKNGSTPLHQLAYHGTCEDIMFLINLGADPARRTQGGWYPFHHAFKRGMIEVASDLYVSDIEKSCIKHFFEDSQEKERFLHALRMCRVNDAPEDRRDGFSTIDTFQSLLVANELNF